MNSIILIGCSLANGLLNERLSKINQYKKFINIKRMFIMATGKIMITVENLKMYAELNDGKTAQEIWEALPIEGSVNTWGDEIYFSIPVKVGLENAKAVVLEGDLGYWPPGNAFCIFFGPTPASHGEEIKPASPVNVFGKIIGDPKIFKKVRSGAKIIIEKS